MKNSWPLDTAVSFDPYYGEPDRDGDQGYEILPDGKVFLRVKAPERYNEETIEALKKRYDIPIKCIGMK